MGCRGGSLGRVTRPPQTPEAPRQRSLGSCFPGLLREHCAPCRSAPDEPPVRSRPTPRAGHRTAMHSGTCSVSPRHPRLAAGGDPTASSTGMTADTGQAAARTAIGNLAPREGPGAAAEGALVREDWAGAKRPLIKPGAVSGFPEPAERSSLPASLCKEVLLGVWVYKVLSHQEKLFPLLTFPSSPFSPHGSPASEISVSGGQSLRGRVTW